VACLQKIPQSYLNYRFTTYTGVVMNSEWMIDVLADLRKFAQKQAMLELAEHLDDAIMLATVEIKNHNEGRGLGVGVNDAKTGSVSGTLGNNRYS